MNSRHCCLSYLGVGVQYMLNITGVDILTFPYDNVFLPAQDKQVAIFVNLTDITSVKPTILYHLGGGFRIVIIALHYWPPDNYLTRLV